VISPASSRTALIVGAGIGGLAAAIALRRAGWRVRVFERASSPRELGFALVLAPNAKAALRELGLGDALASFGVTAMRGEIGRPDGTLLRRIDLSNVARPGDGAVVALRQALHGALLEAVGAVGEDVLALEHEVVDVETDGESASLRLADGRRESGDIVIGADGVGSVVRRRLHPDEPPPGSSGYFAIRGVARDGARLLQSPIGSLSWLALLGDGVEAGSAVAAERTVYWYLSLLAADVGSERDARRLVNRVTASFDPRFRALIAGTDDADLRLDELFLREPLSEWGRGRVTLLGDAAHPVLPHSGQGAAQALEDAVALGLTLGPEGHPAAALRRYERVRGQRTRGIIALGRRVAGVTTTKSRLVRTIRDGAIRLAPALLIRASLRVGREKDPHVALRA
jgi:2-polyprenyl-6-methoxyphenol hydroxylase-like FAD-dependent oxidoreductase